MRLLRSCWLAFLHPGSAEGGIDTWIIITCAIVMAAGTAAGGWRIIKTLGHKMVKLHPIHGFAAETSSATILTLAAHFGMPVSTTHSISTAIMGVGFAKNPRSLKFGVIERIVWAWILTIPAAGGCAYLILKLFELFGWIVRDQSFLMNSQRLVLMILQVSIIGLLAIGVTQVIITTGIDQEVIAGQTFSVVTVDNGDSGKVKGLELTAQYLHDSGFGFAGNVTATKSSARFGEISGKLEDVTPLSVNLSVLYEQGPISAKVTYSYDKGRTVQLDGFVEGLSVHGDSYEDLSFSASYDLTDRVEVFVEGSNLLDETVRQFNTHRNVPAFYEENGRSFFFGMRARY